MAVLAAAGVAVAVSTVVGNAVAEASISSTAYPDPAAYSHDSTTGATTTDMGVPLAGWMSTVPGDRLLSQMSIPGTHDSGSYPNSLGGEIAQTQTMTIAAQLNAGIRAFDVRAGEQDHSLLGCNGDIYIFHGPICMGETLSDVLSTMVGFLHAHPSETILMRLGSSGAPTTGTYQGDVCSVVKAAADQVNADYMYNGSSSNPALRDLRGKIFLLANGLGDGGATKDGGSCTLSSFSHPVDYGSLNAQDDYAQSAVWKIQDKWAAVKSQFIAANSGHPDTIYINYLSAANGAFPCTFASGKALCGTHAAQLATGLTYGYTAFGNDGTCKLDSRCMTMLNAGLYETGACVGDPDIDTQTCSVYYEGENMMAEAYIAGSNFAGPDNDDLSHTLRPGFPGIQGRTGIVMADFPGSGLIDSIIDVNSQPWPTVTAAPTTSPNAHGWYNHPVVVAFTCSNVATGACPPPQTILGDGASLSSTPVAVTDPTGVKTAESNVVTVNIDKTPPVITTPGPLTADGTLPTGTKVSFNTSFADATSGVQSNACTPHSGSVFPIGTTTVTCTAQDFAGNTSSSSFTVHIKGAAEQLADIRAEVQGVGPGTSLSDKIAQAQSDRASGDLPGTCRVLGATVHELRAQSGKKIPARQAATLAESAQRVRAVLGC